MAKKNVWLGLCVAVLFLSLGSAPVLALDLTIASVEAGAGAEGVVVDIAFSAATSIKGAQFDVAYDATKLTFKTGTWDTTAFPFSKVAITGGNVRVVIAGTAEASVTSVAKLTFNVAADATGSYPITFVDGSLTINPATVVATPKNGSLTITQKPKVTATATPAEGGSITPADNAKTYDVGATPTYTVTVAPTYRVMLVGGFTVTGDAAAKLSATNTYTLAALKAGDDIKIAVLFEKIPQYTVIASSDANGTISDVGSKTYPAGATPEYTVTANKNYELDKLAVSTDPAAQSKLTADGKYTFAALASDATISVTFKLRQYKVTATAGAGGAISDPGEKTYSAGSTPSYTVTPTAGYMVDKFTVSTDAAAVLTPSADGKTFTYKFASIEANATVDVTFKLAKNTVKVTLTPAAGGTVTPAPDATTGEVKFDPGTDAVLTVKANTGYKVTEVKMDGIATVLQATGVYTFPKIAADHTLAVTFVKATMYKVKASATPAEGGTIDPAGEKEVAEGDSQAYTLKANATWVLDKVTVNGVVKEVTGTTFTVSDIKADTAVVVTFKKSGTYSSADFNYDYTINLTELLRVSQLYNTGSYSCKPGTDDGFAPGAGDMTCTKHTSDYDNAATGSKADWKIELSEFLRLIQFYNVGAYEVKAGTEDGFAPKAN